MSFEEILKTLGSGLGQFGWNDLLDIAILTVLLYKLIVWTKDTRAYEVIKGVGGDRFDPDGTLTLQQAILIAERTRVYLTH